MIIGMTGGSGSGKSSIASAMSDDGFFVIDADEVSRYVVLKGKPAYNEIKENFGENVFFKDGTLNRKKLGDIVFADSMRLNELNLITHKYIRKEIKERINNNKNKDIIIDAALLKKGGLTQLCDTIIGITAKKDVRISRIVKRDNISFTAAENRINSQESDEEYKSYCDRVFDNSGEKSIDELKEEIKLFIERKRTVEN